MTKLIISEPITGLGNRLRCIASLMHIARKVGAGFRSDWPVFHDCPAPFEDLYTEPINDLIPPPDGFSLDGTSPEDDPNTLFLAQATGRRILEPSDFNSDVIRAKAAYFYFLKEDHDDPKTRAACWREAGKILRGFALHPYVEDQVERVSEKVDITSRVGVHVRRGDVNLYRRVEVGQYFQVIAERYQDEPLFLATDSDEVVKEFQREYGDRVAIFDSRTRDREQRIALQDALVEIYLLSRTTKLLTGCSSFTEASAMIGGLRRDVLWPEE